MSPSATNSFHEDVKNTKSHGKIVTEVSGFDFMKPSVPLMVNGLTTVIVSLSFMRC